MHCNPSKDVEKERDPIKRPTFIVFPIPFFIFPAFNNENWPLKPLFFEVPSISSTTFVGRKWLFREVLEHLSSDLPTSGGMIIQGMQASGKSSIILMLVQGSCFGHQGKFWLFSPIFGIFSQKLA